MQLQNRFDDADKQRVWLDHQFCALCGSNQNCSLHHIDGCKHKCHASILNSIMLCYECHKIADGHNVNDEKFKRKLTEKTLRHLFRHTDYRLKPIDYDYLEEIYPRIQVINLESQ